MSKHIKKFSEISKKDVNIAGGKGASLGEMINHEISVPDGFVVLATAFDRFMEEVDLTQDISAEIEQVKYEDINSVDRASNVIRDLIVDAKMPKDLVAEITAEFNSLKADYVAVRSSATAEDSSVASWAGELESYLNTNEETLLVNVKRCWASLFTARAIFYRHEKKLHDSKVSVAVVVQKMVQSEVSGISFTVHPVTKDYNQMIIEAGWGLGEAIVSGQITPDSYVIDKKDFSLIDVNVSTQERMIVKNNAINQPEAKIRAVTHAKKAEDGVIWKEVLVAQQAQQKLSNQQIVELAKICLQVEKHYGFPCDIEWGLFNNDFYILQSRPITTL